MGTNAKFGNSLETTERKPKQLLPGQPDAAKRVLKCYSAATLSPSLTQGVFPRIISPSLGAAPHKGAVFTRCPLGPATHRAPKQAFLPAGFPACVGLGASPASPCDLNRRPRSLHTCWARTASINSGQAASQAPKWNQESFWGPGKS